MNQPLHPTPPQVAEELRFSSFGLTLAAKRWGNPTGIPTLALHGWLDNANTFDNLAPALPELDLVALDFAGHGKSDHRQTGIHYHPLLDMQDILAVSEQLGWETFQIIGHSMGAAIASEFAATFPQRVSRAVCIDGFLATGGATTQERIEQNREALQQMQLAGSKAPKAYPDTQTMVQRVTQATDQSAAAAAILVARGHVQLAGGGVTWRTDPRIRFATPLRPTSEFINALIAQTKAPTLLIFAEQGDRWYQGEVAERQQHHPNLTVARMPGPHHLHLEPQHVAAVAAQIRQFLLA